MGRGPVEEIREVATVREALEMAGSGAVVPAEMDDPEEEAAGLEAEVGPEGVGREAVVPEAREEADRVEGHPEVVCRAAGQAQEGLNHEIDP